MTSLSAHPGAPQTAARVGGKTKTPPYLILRESDERADDDTDALRRHCRQLVAQGLAAPRGHHHQSVVAIQHLPYRLLRKGPRQEATRTQKKCVSRASINAQDNIAQRQVFWDRDKTAPRTQTCVEHQRTSQHRTAALKGRRTSQESVVE